MVFWWKSGQNRKSCFQNIEKALATEGFPNAFSRQRKTLQNQWKINIFESRNSVAENLMKQMVFCWKIRPNHKKWFQIIEKALPTEGFPNAFSRRRKTLWNEWKINYLKGQNSLSQILIKQMVFWWKSSQNRIKDLKNIEKALPRECFQIAFLRW